LLGLVDGQPVAGAGALLFGAFDAADAGGERGLDETVIGGFGGQAAHGRQPDVAGGGSQALLVEVAGVALHGSLGKALAGARGHIPAQEIVERAIVGAAGVGRGDGVEDEGLDASESGVGRERDEVFRHLYEMIPEVHLIRAIIICYFWCL
jgi:hypothetical protein